MSRKVLVVDDYGEMREFVSLLLRDRFEIVTACDGNDALNCLRQHGHMPVNPLNKYN